MYLMLFQKFVARKARKFQMQGNRLALPGLEMTYIFHGIAQAPGSIIAEKMLPEIDILAISFFILTRLNSLNRKECA